MVTFLCNGEKWDHIGPLRDLALEYGYRYYITDSITDIGKVLTEITHTTQTEIICVLGGDGTICQLITPLFRNQEQQKRKGEFCPTIAVLGGGTMNNLFKLLGGKGSPDRVAKRVVQKMQRGTIRTKRIPLLRVEHAGQVFFGFMFALGPIVRLLKKYTDEKRNVFNAVRTAIFSSSASLIGLPLSFKKLIYPIRAAIVIDETKQFPTQEFASIITATIPRTTFGFYPFMGNDADISSRTGQFFALFSSLLPYEVILWLPHIGYCGIWKEMKIRLPSLLSDQERHFNRPVKSLTIQSNEEFFTVDGEIFEMQSGKTIAVTQGPEISLVYPL